MLCVIYGLIGLGVACAAWALIPQAPVSVRMNGLTPMAGSLTPVSRMMPERGRNFFAPMLSGIGRIVTRFSHREHHDAKEDLVYTGVTLTAEQWAGVKVLSALGCAFVSFTVAKEFGQIQPVWVGLAGAFGLILPNLWMKARMRRRQRAIIRLLPEVIDLLSLCIGGGLDFLAALNKVVLVKTFQQQPLIEELSIVLQEIKLGKRRFEALKALAKRVNAPEVSSFVRTLVQADRMGTPIAEVLSIHSEDIRFERFMRAERAALKAPIKILIPLIFCIMPCVALIVGAPIFLQFMNQNPFGK